MELESIKSAFEVDGFLGDIYAFDTRSADPDRFLAASKDWGYAARKPKTVPRRLQNEPGPALEERGTGRPWKRFGEIDGADGPRRRAPEKMVGAAGFEPATPTPPV